MNIHDAPDMDLVAGQCFTSTCALHMHNELETGRETD
jgi:hypothetical protein